MVKSLCTNSELLIVPVATILFVNRPEMISKLIQKTEYIVYPAEVERPPTGTKEDVDEFLRKLLAKDAARKSADEPVKTDVVKGEHEAVIPKTSKWFGIF